MARRKIEVEIYSHGLYERWDPSSRELPRLVKMTREMTAFPGIEFGYILRIRNARKSLIRFRIEHPPFNDSQGHPAPPFCGELYVKTSDYRFFLGDTLKDPIEEKCGTWRLITWVDDHLYTDISFQIHPPEVDG